MSLTSSAVASSSRSIGASSSRLKAGLTTRNAAAPSRRAASSRLPAEALLLAQTLPPSWLLPSRASLMIPGSRNFSFTSHPNARARSSTSSDTDLSYPTHLTNPTPYDIFHFPSRTVTSSEIKSRYYDLVRTCHPDRFPHSCSSKTKTSAEEEFKSIISAYNLLKDPHTKQLYDRAGIGWNSSTSSLSTNASDLWKDHRYTRRYNPSYTGPGHDRFGWQNQTFYNPHFSPHHSHHGSAGWNGGNGQYTSNGIFITSLFLLTWLLAGLQYSRLSLQSAKAIERADKSHLDAAKSLNDAREAARSEEGRQRWSAFRRRAREQKVMDDLDRLSGGEGEHGKSARLEEYVVGQYGVGHGGPSGKQAAQERFAKAKAQLPAPVDAS